MQHRELSSLVFATLELSSLLNYKKKHVLFFSSSSLTKLKD